MTEQMQKDAELYRSMRDMAKARGFESVAEAILVGPKERQRAELAEADNAKLLDLSQRLLDFATKGAPAQGDDAFLTALGQAVTQPHPGAALLDEVEKLRALQVPVPEDDLTRLERLLASASQGDVWAWLDNARALFPSMAAELRARRAPTKQETPPSGEKLTGLQVVKEILERVKENPNGVGDAALDLHAMAVAEVKTVEQAAKTLDRLGVGDYTSDVRDREHVRRETPSGASTWDHPDVKAWSDASQVMQAIAKGAR